MTQVINISHDTQLLNAYGQKKYEPTAKIARTHSTTGYCQEIVFLQYRHLPLSEAQLITGMRSIHLKQCLQCTHIDRPRRIDKSFDGFFFFSPPLSCILTRHTRALTKLPRAKPSTPSNIYIILTSVTENRHKS